MLSVVIAASLTAQAPAPPSRQQAFESAAAAAERQDWESAFAQFDALEAGLVKGKSTRSLALVRLRKGEALLGLGRLAEGEVSVRAGLAALPASDPSLLEDRVLAHMILGALAERRYDYPAAYREFGIALKQGVGTPLTMRALVGTVRTGTFIDARAAATVADGAVRGIAGTDKAAKELRAQWRTLKGRALLNAGDFASASVELETATKELGGLTNKVGYADLVARSDMAIAALLAGQADKAREYLAYTGAGRFTQGYLPTPIISKVPACGDATGLRPDDVAVVEVALRDNGRVSSSAPIYGSRPQVAAAFAKSVSDWTWPAEQVAKLTPLIRQVTRLELRCRQSPERLSVIDYVEREHDRWVATLQSSPTAQSLRELPLATLKERFAAAGDGVDARTRLALARAIVDHRGGDRIGIGEAERQATAIADRGEVPPLVLVYWKVRQAAWGAGDAVLPPKEAARRYDKGIAALFDRPAIRGEVRARAAVMLMRAERLGGDGKEAEAEALLTDIADDPALVADDDLRIAAKVRLAQLMAGQDKPDKARLAYQSAGLSGRCPVLDLNRPVAKLNSDSGDFPDEALRWGFEGWAVPEVRIGPDGRATGGRTLIAYPPFVFGKAGERIVLNSRYKASYRAESEAACGGQSTSIRFSLGG